ncbi:hypothetical protein SAMN05444682_10295 [Parapedobacter indicus]|uniref:Uncharacterized protein n=1 Tax=Parapedobacter indicus TaxID=1477437 RepID=A0A1I3EZV7_9SPHI|nr:hypothetical protein CLV26_10295 [Parapedobacter indicus]SFI04476.1 hypothetical protein SAMN05444682_10295 [Parapedobacter indicus]
MPWWIMSYHALVVTNDVNKRFCKISFEKTNPEEMLLLWVKQIQAT